MENDAERLFLTMIEFLPPPVPFLPLCGVFGRASQQDRPQRVCVYCLWYLWRLPPAGHWSASTVGHLIAWQAPSGSTAAVCCPYSAGIAFREVPTSGNLMMSDLQDAATFAWVMFTICSCSLMFICGSFKPAIRVRYGIFAGSFHSLYHHTLF